jgi:FAD:protein FMN transferase
MRATFETMGTTASVDVPSSAFVGIIEDVFARADETFSLYSPTSELSRIARGELTMMDASSAVRDAYGCAVFWREQTDGAFSPHRPDGVIDLNGVVKARAIADAADLLIDAGVTEWSINVGGDVLHSELRTDGSAWSVGIADPADHSALLCAVELDRAHPAIATSGSAERGDHIWRGRSGDAPEFVQATVIAADIVTADVLATAIIAGGSATLDLVTERFAVDVLTVDRAGALRATPGLRSALAA